MDILRHDTRYICDSCVQVLSFFPSLLQNGNTTANNGVNTFFLCISRCDAGYTGEHCEKKDYSVLYVVPGPVRFQYVLIAAVIGTIQIAIICVVVLCITRSVMIASSVAIKVGGSSLGPLCTESMSWG